jgi:hypothetical protein
MENESNSHSGARERLPAHLHRMKRYRRIALVIFLCFAAYGLLPHMWTALRSARQEAGAVGSIAPTPGGRSLYVELEAFRLGKSVADYSARRLIQASARPGQPDSPDLLRERTVIQARLAALQTQVSFETLDANWQSGTFDSPASHFVADALALRYDVQVRTAYLLGAQWMSARWRAGRLQNTIVWERGPDPAARSEGAAGAGSANTPAALLSTLQTLTLGVIGRQIKPNEFQPPMVVRDLIRSENSAADALLLQLYSLDMAVETALAMH